MYESGDLMTEISVLLKKNSECWHTPSALQSYSKKTAILEEVGTTRHWCLDLGLLKNCEKLIWFLSAYPVYGIFIIATQMDQNISSASNMLIPKGLSEGSPENLTVDISLCPSVSTQWDTARPPLLGDWWSPPAGQLCPPPYPLSRPSVNQVGLPRIRKLVGHQWYFQISSTIVPMNKEEKALEIKAESEA